MVMDTLQIRINHGLVKRVDLLVEEGIYESRSEAVRDAVRRFVWNREVGSLKDGSKIDSVTEIKRIRRKLSKKPIDLEKINKS